MKPLGSFHRLSRVKSGRRAICAACIALWREENHAKVQENKRRYREENRDEINRRQREAWANDPERHRAQLRVSYQRHREKRMAESREWGRKNPERKRQKNAEWAAQNPEKVKAIYTRQNRRRRAGRTQVGADYAEVLYCDPCCYCGATTEHIDHIEALAVGGANGWTNLTAACRSCNDSKQKATVLHYLLRRDA